MAVTLYNTMSRHKESLFDPEKKTLSMYVCGVTVYDYSHIGHARSAIAFDVVVRYLRYRGYDVNYIRNFTDVDDKIIKRANEMGISTTELADEMIEEYRKDVARLGCVSPDLEPRVTETIDEIIDTIQKIVDNGYGYVVDGDVYFSVTDYPGYGKLSGRSLSEMLDGARVEVDERLKSPKDFALWKAAKPGEPSWDSPWGKGRPGWHIECTAMNLKHHGVQTDIHGGGKDLVFPHHENEIAQAEAATGVKPWVRWWMHNGFVNVVKDGVEEKMSKSLGNFSTIREATAKTHPEVLRLLMVSTHYRKDLNYGAEPILEAQKRLLYFYETLARVDEILGGKEAWTGLDPDPEIIGKFVEAMDDDFNVPVVLAHLSPVFKEMNDLARKDVARVGVLRRTVDEIGSVLGLFQSEPASTVEEIKRKAMANLPLSEEEIEALIEERAQARKAKNWARADEIRDSLAAKGIILKDSKDGTTWSIG